MVFFKRSQPQLLLDILENMNCMLDIQVLCIDGSFMWSRLLLSRLSPYMNLILKKAEDIDALILDNGMKEKTVHDALINLLQVKPEWKEEYQGVYELLCVPVTSKENVIEEKESIIDILKVEPVEVSDEETDFALDALEDSRLDEENDLPEKVLPVNDVFDDDVKNERINNEKHENNLCSKTQIDKKVKKVKSTNPKRGGDKKVRKRRAASIKTEKDNVWTRDPSPERFLGGKKVKYICVTQENVVSGPPYFCIGCNYKSNLIINVKKHYRMHSNEKPFGCKECGKKFSTSTTVFSHWNRRHNENWIKEFSCDICGLLFPSQPELMRHRVVHSGESFACTVCGKAFDSPYKRDAHELRHKQQTVPCPICGKEFVNQRNAERHQVRHEGSRNFECEICGKKSKTQGDLRVHKKIMHSDVEDCECSVCGKIFKRKLYLDNHMKRVHEKSTKFQCLLCPQVLSTKQHYKRHSLRCHDGQMIPVSNRVKS